MRMEDFCGSEFWDTEKIWNSNDPALTKCFQETVLVWMPCTFLWILSIFEIIQLINSNDRNIPWSFFNVSKLILTSVLVSISITDLILTIFVRDDNIYAVDYYTPIVEMCTLILSIILVYANKRRGQRASGVLFLFWLFFGICSIPQFKIILEDEGITQGITYNTSSVLIKFIVLMILIILNGFADREATLLKYPKSSKPCPENQTGFVAKLLFCWFDSIAWKGYKKPLIFSDVWDLNAENCTKQVYQRANWQKQKQEQQNTIKKDSKTKQHTPSVVGIFWKSYWHSFLFAQSLRFFHDISLCASPIILRLLIQYVDTYELEARPLWHGLILTILLFINGNLQSIFMEQHYYRVNIISLHIRAALISAIFQKSLKSSNAIRTNSSAAEIINLVSVDVQRFVETVTSVSVLWSTPLLVSISLYMLWNILGIAAIAGLLAIILMLPINAFVVSKSKVVEGCQIKVKDKRIKLLNEIFNGIKILKLYAWESNFEQQVHNIRNDEVNLLKKNVYLDTIIILTMLLTSILITVCAFTVYILIDEEHVLTAEIAFVTISLYNIIRFPILYISVIISRLIQATISTKRINKFLNMEELEPLNIIKPEIESNCSSYLSIEKGTFIWDENSFILHNISMKVEKNQLIGIVGTIASGKSSLISAIFGEMTKISGHVRICGKTALVPQQAWIQNCSLRDNILFGNQMNEAFYKQVISACALQYDIDQLPFGDLTEIGEKGINLSGGQRQRISLARAIYSDADIFILDDPLSAVDSHVSNHIFMNVIDHSGILGQKCRILITHGVSYLSKIDYIYVMNDGRISESGTYDSLLKRMGPFFDFINNYAQPRNEANRTEKESVNSNINHQGIFRTSLKPSDQQNQNLIQVEKLETGNIKLKTAIFYFKNYGFLLSVLTIFLNCIFKGIAIGSNFWLAKWSTDKNIAYDYELQDMYLGIYGLLNFIMVLTFTIASLLIRIGCLRASISSHKYLLNGLIRAPLRFFESTPIGRIISRFSGDIDIIDKILVQCFTDFVWCSFEVASIILTITITTYEFLAVIGPLAFLYYLLQRFYISTGRQIKRLESASKSPIFSHVGETLQGLSVIRAYNAQNRFISTIEDRIDDNQKCAYFLMVSNRWISVRLQLIGNFVILFATLFAVLSREHIGAGLAGLSISSALQITFGLNWLLRMSCDFESHLVAVERIKEYSEIKPEAPWFIKEENSQTNNAWPSNGMIEFKNYNLRYNDGMQLVLKDISIVIEGGEKIGIVGRTGAGKSSLTLALLRIIEASNGAIIIDGINISKLGLHNLRSKISIIPQDPVLFSGSLRMNLDPFNHRTEDEIWTVLEQAHLKEFVENFEAALDFQVSESGENLSVGQKQLICLCRVLVRKSKILVLDEATASIDLETDKLIQATIRTVYADCTVLTIAHRINTIMDSDRILVLDKGRIAEFSTPHELLQNKESIFYSLAKSTNLIE